MNIVFQKVPSRCNTSVKIDKEYEVLIEKFEHYLIIDEDKMTCIILKDNPEWQYRLLNDTLGTEESKLVPRVNESGSKRDSNANKPFIHNLKGYTRLRFGFLMNIGARKYGDGNWEKGMPIPQYLESIDRHLALYMEGDRSEDHLSCILFGINGIMQEEKKLGILPNHYFKENLETKAIQTSVHNSNT